MKINAALLKEKNIIVNQFIPSPEMRIEMKRNNFMPSAPNRDNLQCELQVDVNIKDKEGKILVSLKLVYLVISVLEKGDVYSQQEYADRIYKALQSMFFSSANELLRETPFPPLPLDIRC